MKVITKNDGKRTLKMTKAEWREIGKTAGFMENNEDREDYLAQIEDLDNAIQYLNNSAYDGQVTPERRNEELQKIKEKVLVLKQVKDEVVQAKLQEIIDFLEKNTLISFK